MKQFTVDWLGRCGPHHIIVEMPVEEARELLQMALVADTESWPESLFETNRRYTGKIRQDRFDVMAIWRNRRFRPSLTGRFEPLDDGATRIHFQVEMDSTVLLLLILPCLFYLTAVIAMFFLSADWMWLPIAVLSPIFFVAVTGLNLWFARRESVYLLEFFIKLFR